MTIISSNIHAGFVTVEKQLFSHPKKTIFVITQTPHFSACLVIHPNGMKITQPRVARHELPWENAPNTDFQPQSGLNPALISSRPSF